jgi:hypothetical protein
LRHFGAKIKHNCFKFVEPYKIKKKKIKLKEVDKMDGNLKISMKSSF